MKKEKIIKKFIDTKGTTLYKKYNFLHNYRNINTLLFVIDDNIYISYSLNNNIIYNVFISSIYSTETSYIKFDELKYILINKDYNKLESSFLNSHKILHGFEKNLLHDLNDWLNNFNINNKKVYKLYQI